MPGRTAGNGRVGGLLIAVKITYLPIGGLHEEHRNTQTLEAFSIAAAAGASGIGGVEAGVGVQLDAQLLGDAQGVFAQRRQFRYGGAVRAGMGIHHVAGDQAVDVDHAGQAGARLGIQGGDIGA
ncbi:hypothetical protein SRABI70_03643 [Pseudomonas sp. Bi70]|nr:hypothetical protein SRABI70_03643 [Pseudomonas sp. Bi70]